MSQSKLGGNDCLHAPKPLCEGHAPHSRVMPIGELIVRRIDGVAY